MRALHILMLYTFSYVAGAVNIYIETPVIIIDCRSSRQDGQWTIGTTEATTQITQKPADPKELYNAAKDGDLQYIENEISRFGPSGLNLDWQNPDDYKWTALHISVYENKPSIVSTLLTAGANPNVQDEGGQTPVYIAARSNKLDVLRLLLDPKYQADVNVATNDGRTPVYRTASEGYTTALELLLAQGGDPNKLTNSGWSPLLTTTGGSGIKSTIARALLAAGAHVNYAKPDDGITALHRAARNNKPDVALALLEAGANKNIETNVGKTPAKCARSWGNKQLAELIENF